MRKWLTIGFILGFGVIGFAQSGPYSAQIQRAIRDLLAGNQTITGTWTFVGKGAAFGSLAVPNNCTSFNYFDCGLAFNVMEQTSSTGFVDAMASVDTIFNLDGSGGGISFVGTAEISTALTAAQQYVVAVEPTLVLNSGSTWTGGTWGATTQALVYAQGTADITTQLIAVEANFETHNTSHIQTGFAFYASSLKNALFGTSNITNAYAFWSDEQGVYRIKADNTFNAVYQAIPALYNPQFTKYTPGAANFERCVPGCQWESNVAVLTTEAGGTGMLRGMQLGDTGVPMSMKGGEQTAPAAPAANNFVLYAQDNGAGKAQLCVRFNTGANQCFATQP